MPLLNTVQGEAVEGEGILKGYVGRKLVFEERFAIDDHFDFSRDEGVVEEDGVAFVFEGDCPLVPLLAGFDVFAHLLDVEVEGFDLLI